MLTGSDSVLAVIAILAAAGIKQETLEYFLECEGDFTVLINDDGSEVSLDVRGLIVAMLGSLADNIHGAPDIQEWNQCALALERDSDFVFSNGDMIRLQSVFGAPEGATIN